MASSTSPVLTVAFVLLTLGAAFHASGADAVAEGTRLVEQSRAKYATLRSYSDTVSIVTEYRQQGAPPIVERHRVQTRYNAPRNFFFQFEEDPKAGAELYVIWCDGGDFNSWWSTTRVHDVYSGGRGELAFVLGTPTTRGATALLPTWIFPKANMTGPLTSLQNARLETTEKLGNRMAHRIAVDVDTSYSNGRGAQSRPAILWIDVQTSLLLKVFLDTPRGTAGGLAIRETFDFEPKADPKLDVASFRFTVPAG